MLSLGLSFTLLIIHNWQHITDSVFKKDLYILAILALVYIIFASEQLGIVPTYDSGAYYGWSIRKLSNNFKFDFSNIFEYCLAQHISIGYALLACVGELLSPGTAWGVQFGHIFERKKSSFCV